MARGKRWAPGEIKMLQEMVEQGLTADEIFKSGKFPERTHKAIAHEMTRFGSIWSQKKFRGPQIIEAPIVDIESFLKRYVDAFNKLCELKEYDKQELERFRLIHTYARDYPALLVEHERLRQVEEAMVQINKRLEALETQAAAQSQ